MNKNQGDIKISKNPIIASEQTHLRVSIVEKRSVNPGENTIKDNKQNISKDALNEGKERRVVVRGREVRASSDDPQKPGDREPNDSQRSPGGPQPSDKPLQGASGGGGGTGNGGDGRGFAGGEDDPWRELQRNLESQMSPEMRPISALKIDLREIGAERQHEFQQFVDSLPARAQEHLANILEVLGPQVHHSFMTKDAPLAPILNDLVHLSVEEGGVLYRLPFEPQTRLVENHDIMKAQLQYWLQEPEKFEGFLKLKQQTQSSLIFDGSNGQLSEAVSTLRRGLDSLLELDDRAQNVFRTFAWEVQVDILSNLAKNEGQWDILLEELGRNPRFQKGIAAHEGMNSEFQDRMVFTLSTSPDKALDMVETLGKLDSEIHRILNELPGNMGVSVLEKISTQVQGAAKLLEELPGLSISSELADKWPESYSPLGRALLDDISKIPLRLQVLDYISQAESGNRPLTSIMQGLQVSTQLHLLDKVTHPENSRQLEEVSESLYRISILDNRLQQTLMGIPGPSQIAVTENRNVVHVERMLHHALHVLYPGGDLSASGDIGPDYLPLPVEQSTNTLRQAWFALEANGQALISNERLQNMLQSYRRDS